MPDRRTVKAILLDSGALTLAVLAGVIWRGAPILSDEFAAAAFVFGLALAARMAALSLDVGGRS